MEAVGAMKSATEHICRNSDKDNFKCDKALHATSTLKSQRAVLTDSVNRREQLAKEKQLELSSKAVGSPEILKESDTFTTPTTNYAQRCSADYSQESV